MDFFAFKIHEAKLVNQFLGWLSAMRLKEGISNIAFLVSPKFCCKGNRASCTLLSSIALMYYYQISQSKFLYR